MITCAPFVRIRSLAIAIVCRPDEQKRLMVIALVSTGSPARIAAARATFIPCSASGIAQPMITSSTCAPSRPGTRAIASLIAAAPMSSGLVSRKVPFGALPTEVLTAETITASFIIIIVGARLVLARCPGAGTSPAPYINSLTACPFSTYAQFDPASFGFRSKTEMPLVRDQANTVRSHASCDLDRHPSKCARASHRSKHRDRKYNRRASSDVPPISTSLVPVRPTRECRYAVVVAHSHSRPARALAFLRQQSNDRRSSKLSLVAAGIPGHAPLRLRLLLSRVQWFQTHASQTETDRRLSGCLGWNPSRAPASL